ncbi:MAG: 5'/3'-nucleotidase SurE [Phormidesmis sp.]
MTLMVLTNDDGIGAPGIIALQQALSDGALLDIENLESVVVAPDAPLSGCSHQMNRGGIIPIDRRGEGEYAIGGTPADCSRVALSHLYPEADWVLSGINAGGNMGSDVYLSGTVAAVREATLLRKRAIALSQYRYRNQPFDWSRASRLTAKVLSLIMTKPLAQGEFWNVNLPAPPLDTPQNESADEPDIIFCQSCTQPLPTDFEIDEAGFRYVGAYEDRLRDPDGDVAVCLSGHISVVKIQLW